MIIAILLDGSQENIFYPGQNVTGHIRVETNEEMKMRGIRLEVHGDARVQWSEGSGNNRRHYSGHENFIDLKTYLIGSDNKDLEMTLKPGVHTFPLSFVLPDNIPSSFEGLHGYIRYKVQAIVDRPWKIDDYAEILLTVIRYLNLNYEPPQLREPIVVQEEKPMVGCCYHCCCIRGHLNIELRINKGCFVPGETIILSGQVANKSNTRIKKTSIKFMQETQFFAASGGVIYHRTHHNKTLDSTKRPQIESGCTDIWSDVSFTIPPLVASRLDGSNIINIYYYMQVKVDFAKGCCTDSRIRQEIVIGHVPLQGDTQFCGPITTQPPMYSSPLHSEFSEQSNYSGVHNEGWKQDYSATSVDYK